jgi:membrane protein DedA with SNARE-associated domain
MDLAEPVLAFLARYIYVTVLLSMIIDATGVPFPGRVVLVAAGAFAAGGDAHVTLIIALGALGALIGDHLWYIAGRMRGQALLELYCRAFPSRRACSDRAHDYLARFGAYTFTLGRFIAGVRILAAPVAASGGVTYPKFLVADAVGAVLWAGTFTLLGYFVGAGWPRILERVGIAGGIVVGALSVAAVAGVAIAWRRFSRSPRDAPRPARDRRPRRAG